MTVSIRHSSQCVLGKFYFLVSIVLLICIGTDHQRPEDQPGRREVVQADEHHGQSFDRVSVHAGLLHLPLLLQVRH